MVNFEIVVFFTSFLHFCFLGCFLLELVFFLASEASEEIVPTKAEINQENKNEEKTSDE
jgi:hypothetical protein